MRSAWDLKDPEATHALAAALARGLTPGTVIALRGELGAGKTTLVRGLLRALGYQGRVKSPTYPLLETYNISSLYFYHFDFYRIKEAQELEDAGFRDCFDGSAVCLVEWPEKAGDWLPEPDLTILMEIVPEGRRAELESHSERGVSCMPVQVSDA